MHARAVKDLNRCAVFFFMCSLYLVIYNLALHWTHNDVCLFEWLGTAGNNCVWFLSRAIQNVIWTIPIYLLFWPSSTPLLSKLRRCLKIREHNHDRTMSDQMRSNSDLYSLASPNNESDMG